MNVVFPQRKLDLSFNAQVKTFTVTSLFYILFVLAYSVRHSICHMILYDFLHRLFSISSSRHVQNDEADKKQRVMPDGASIKPKTVSEDRADIRVIRQIIVST